MCNEFDDEDFMDPPPPPRMSSRYDNPGGFECGDNDFVNHLQNRRQYTPEIGRIGDDDFLDSPPLVGSGGNGRRHDNGETSLKKCITMIHIYMDMRMVS